MADFFLYMKPILKTLYVSLGNIKTCWQHYKIMLHLNINPLPTSSSFYAFKYLIHYGYKILLITLWLLKLDIFTLNSLLQRLNEECQYVIHYYKIKDLSQHIITAYVFSSLFTQYSALNFSLQLAGTFIKT